MVVIPLKYREWTKKNPPRGGINFNQLFMFIPYNSLKYLSTALPRMKSFNLTGQRLFLN